MSGSGLLSTKNPINPHLLARGVSGEVADLRRDLADELAPLAGICVEEYTNLPAATVSGLKAATATVLTAVVLTVTDLLLGGVLAFPRLLTFSTAGGTPAHAPATATVEGTDVKGRFQSEVITLAQTAATATSTKAFKTVTKVTYAVGDGTGATVSIGWAASVGLPRAIKARAGLTEPIKEIVDGAALAPATGTFTSAATNPPYGTYSPATGPNGAHDYCIFFEGDATLA